MVAGGKSESPRQVHLAIVEEAERLAREGVEESLYQQVRKAAYGSLLRGLNSFESIAVGCAEGVFHGCDHFRFPEVFETITKADLEQFIAEYIVPDRATISIVHPKQKVEVAKR